MLEVVWVQVSHMYNLVHLNPPLLIAHTAPDLDATDYSYGLAWLIQCPF